MQVITNYMACDGTIFEDETECEKYETKKSEERTIKFLDGDLNEIKITDYEDISTFLDSEEYFFVKIDTEEDMEYLDRIDECEQLPHYYGISYWNEDYGDWVDIEDEIFDLSEKLEKLKKAKEILNSTTKKEVNK